MRGIIGYGAYVPYQRLDREAIGAAHGGSAGTGTRAVASYDEDTTSMGVEAARLALRSVGPEARELPRSLWFSTTAPSYADKTNATTIHAALRLDRQVPALDMNGAVRSASGALQAALAGGPTTLVVAADARTGLPNSADEREGGDAAAAFLVGDDSGAGAPVIAELLGGASTTEEFTDRWRVPGDVRSKQWEERFGETRYVPLAAEAWKLALDAAGIGADEVDSLLVAGTHARAVRVTAKQLGATVGALGDDLAATVGNPGAAQPGLLLANALDGASAGQVIALLVLADGADVLLFRTTDAITSYRPHRTVADQTGRGGSLPYLKFLSWTGMVTVQPPNRPEPARASSSAAVRNDDWKFGLVASRDDRSGALHMPPARVSFKGGDRDHMTPVAMADVEGTIATFTVDRLAYSPSPPIVFAVVDFDGGGRLPIELTDVDAADVRIGQRVEMTFRRLNQSDGIQNYFWKAKPVAAPGTTAPSTEDDD